MVVDSCLFSSVLAGFTYLVLGLLGGDSGTLSKAARTPQVVDAAQKMYTGIGYVSVANSGAML